MSCAALCSTTARTTACDERTSAAGRSPPLPACRICSVVPWPLTRTAGSSWPPSAQRHPEPKMKSKSTVLGLQWGD
eukprot:5779242-Amphidinium_carterae.1